MLRSDRLPLRATFDHARLRDVLHAAPALYRPTDDYTHREGAPRT